MDDVLDSLQLERTVYHSGALIGNDVNKLVKKGNIEKLCHVFKSREVMLNNGQKQILEAMRQPNFWKPDSPSSVTVTSCICKTESYVIMKI